MNYKKVDIEPDIKPVVSGRLLVARRVVADLSKYGVIVAESSRAPLRLAFPATLASRWMPGLFPEKI